MSPPSGPRHTAGRFAPDSGFTLIEMIAVIVLLGILAVLLVPHYVGFVDSALVSSAKTATGEGATRLSGASRLYAVDTGHPPKALADVSNSTYLDLGAGGTLNIGSFVIRYVAVSGSPPRMDIQALDASGASVLHTLTVDWPN